jgi:integrase
VWQYTVADKKYRPAKLVHHNYDLSKRWYVVFYAWDVSREAIRRRRLFDPINRKKTVTQRILAAEDIIRQVNYELRSGKVLGKDSGGNSFKRKVLKLSLVEAIEFVKEQKKLDNHRPQYVENYRRLKNNLEAWLEYEQRTDFLLRKFDEDDAISFFKWLQSTRKIGNKTHNNYRADFSVAINYLLNINDLLFRKNPLSCIRPLPTLSRKHGAYSDLQMSAIVKKSKELELDQVLLFVRHIYYTLIRPSELLFLKVQDYELDQDRIKVRAVISKNRRDEYVGVAPQLKKFILQSGILDSPPGHFVFGMGAPNEKGASLSYFYRRNQTILKALSFDKLEAKHDLYSYKHSGAISLYKATKDIKLVQAQCRHTSLDQTNNYLRDLGLLSDYDGLKDWDGAAI